MKGRKLSTAICAIIFAAAPAACAFAKAQDANATDRWKGKVHNSEECKTCSGHSSGGARRPFYYRRKIPAATGESR